MMPLLTIKQVCDKLNISRSLCYREIQLGRLRAHRFAKRTYRVSEADLVDYIASNATVAESVPGAPSVPTDSGMRMVSNFKHISVSRLLSSRS